MRPHNLRATNRLGVLLSTILVSIAAPALAQSSKVAYAEVVVDDVAEVDAIVQAAITQGTDDDLRDQDLLLLRLVDLSKAEASRLADWGRLLPQLSIAENREGSVVSVPIAIFGDGGDGANYDRLRGSFDLSVFDLSVRSGAASTQQVVPRDFADEVLTLLQPTRSAPPTQQENACSEASNRLGAVQKLVADDRMDAATVAAFDLACLGAIIPNQELLAAPSYVRDSGAMRIVGVLEHAVSGRDGAAIMEEFCSAFLVDNNTIVSARHCFYDVQRPTARTVAGEAWHSGNVYFRRLVPPFASVKVGPRLAVNWLDDGDIQNRPESQLPLSAADDFIAFTLAEAIPSIPEVRFDTAEGLQPAWVLGPTGIVRGGAIMDADIPRSVRGLRWTRNAPCATAARSDSCALHVCHATKGTSGAALITSSSNVSSVVITGIHLGPYSQLGQTCPAMRSTLQSHLNGAVRASAFMASILAMRGTDDRSN
ncbi:trypsin-like serine protease [Luteimonas sp. SDU101]|uniref:trypsin-like serine protease n=1 Tax=Luteimonas sp. SDU101 TaxID=3422593 RepID=UPI003EC074EA